MSLITVVLHVLISDRTSTLLFFFSKSFLSFLTCSSSPKCYKSSVIILVKKINIIEMKSIYRLTWRNLTSLWNWFFLCRVMVYYSISSRFLWCTTKIKFSLHYLVYFMYIWSIVLFLVLFSMRYLLPLYLPNSIYWNTRGQLNYFCILIFKLPY